MKTNFFKTRLGLPHLVRGLVGLMLTGLPVSWLYGAAIPGLFNTGVDDNGDPLPASTLDPHYTLVASPDLGFPGPDTTTLAPGFPVPPWIAEGPYSRWIAPQANQNDQAGGGNLPGNYTYQTTFDLTGYNPGDAAITGRWWTDNGGVDIVLNQVSLGLTGGGFTGEGTPFTIASGFVEGINTLQFIVSNAAGNPPVANPTGLRIDMLGTVNVPGEAPTILTQPAGQRAVAGDSVTFSVTAIGTLPLRYQWNLNGTPLDDATNATLTLNSVNANDAGDYTATVSNDFGSTTSDPATLTILDIIPTLFNTGVDDNRNLLGPGVTDPHYTLVASGDPSYPGPEVLTLTAGPIPPWVAEGPESRWIAPNPNQNVGNAPGLYRYQTIFDLTSFDETTALIRGQWAPDDTIASVTLNGVDLGLSGGGFNSYTSFEIRSGFIAGFNTLVFNISNGGTAANPTGLRVRMTGAAVSLVGLPPSILTQPASAAALVGETLTLSVEASGTAPLSYQWQKNGVDLPGETGDTLTFDSITLDDQGAYTVVVNNNFGTVTSVPANVLVLVGIPGLYHTGVDDTGALLGDGQPDPHYLLYVSPDAAYPGPLAVTVNEAWPIAPAGPWVANGPNSRWIAPQPDQGAGNGIGVYAYVTFFDLTGFDPDTALLLVNWTADDQGIEIVLNGRSLGRQHLGGFGGFSQTLLDSGFIAGINTLGFLVNNGSDGINPTGLRVELRGGALPATCIWPSSDTVITQPGQTDQVVAVTLPAGLNESAGVTVTVSSDNPAVAVPQGATDGTLALEFPAGGPATQTFTVEALARGSATFTLAGPAESCVGSGITVAVNPSLIANPSFEQNYNPASPSYSSINGWGQIPGGNIGVNEANGPFHDNASIPDRNRVGFVQGVGGLFQVVAGLIPGQAYQLQFRYNRRNCCGDSVQNLTVRFSGQLLTNFTAIPVAGIREYIPASLPFIAVAEIGLLELATRVSGDATLLLDAVTITPLDPDEVPLVNASFEASGLPDGVGYISPALVSGWTYAGAGGGVGVNLSGAGPFADNGVNADQSRVLFLQEQMSISQSVSGLIPGARYELTYACNARNGNLPHLQVSVDGAILQDLDVGAVGGATPYLNQAVPFTPLADTVTLQFSQTAAGDNTLLLDDVHVRFLSNPPVQLNITLLDGGLVRIAWPNTAVGYTLYQSTEAAGPYSDASLPVSPEGTEFVSYDVVIGTSKFYQLVP